jgi:multidrug efflux pump subunit AcrA (membrane-fusion protein)
MISKTYVNEIDISKVKTGQKVQIGVDAFPDRKYTGEVTEVANIGEQMRNSNAKVFEVRIRVNEFDSILRPAMTTKNTIITSVIPDVFFLPIECVHTSDSISFVYKTSGQVRQQVKTGVTNENQIIITGGLKEGEEVYLSPPEHAIEWKLVGL